MSLTCSDCPSPISRQSTTGRCRRCALAVTQSTQQWRDRQRAGAKARLKDPTFRAAQVRRLRAANDRAWNDPDKRASMLAMLAANRARSFTPEARANWLAGRPEAARKRSETVMGWCPPEYREQYRELRYKGKRLKAAEARRVIEEKIAADRALMTPFERQLAKVRAGANIIEIRPARAPDPAYSLTGSSMSMTVHL